MNDLLIQHALSSRFGLFVGDATAQYVRAWLTRFEQGEAGETTALGVMGCCVHTGIAMTRQVELAELAKAFHTAAPATNVETADRGARQRHQRAEELRRRISEQLAASVEGGTRLS